MCKFRFVLADTQDYIDEKESNVDGFIKMLLYVKLQSPHVGFSVLDEPERHSLSWSESGVASGGCPAWSVLLPSSKADQCFL